MSDHEAATRESPLTMAWAAVNGALAFILLLGAVFDALPKLVLSEKQLWIIQFFPDLLVILLLIAIAPFVLRKIDWRLSMQAFRDRHKAERVILTVVAVALVVLLLVLIPSVKYLYEARYRNALVDWHAVQAFDAMRNRDYATALRELRRIAPSTITPEFRAQALENFDGRLKDAETLVTRSHLARKSEMSATFAEILMVGRASRLAPHAPYVTNAISNSRQILNAAVANYVLGVEKLRQSDFGRATTALSRSKQACSRFLHQDLLLRYAGNQDLSTYTADERALITYYLGTPEAKWKADLLAWPPLRPFLPLVISNP